MTELFPRRRWGLVSDRYPHVKWPRDGGDNDCWILRWRDGEWVTRLGLKEVLFVFQWNGAVMGMKQLMIQTLRATLSSLEGSIPQVIVDFRRKQGQWFAPRYRTLQDFSSTPHPQFFMHPVWPMQRNNWRRAVTMSNGFREFALALGILESVMKPVLFNEVWHTSLGKLCALLDR